MNSEQFAKSIDELYERLKALTASKGEEYKRREGNQFANFERGAQALGLTREQVLMVYLSKHLDSITTYVKDRAAGQEKQYAEPITGRIDDAILYLLLLRGMAVENGVYSFGGAEVNDVPGAPGQLYGAEYQEQMKVGGVTTAPRNVPIGLPTLIMSTNQADAIAECNARGLQVGQCALMYPDQLYGRKEGHVIFIHHGNKTDDAMSDEVRRKCEAQGLTFEILAK